MKLYQTLTVSLLLIVVLPLSVCSAAISVQFVAGVPAGWDFYGLESDIQRNNTVDYDDLSLIAQHWLQEGCGDANQWCGKADMDGSSSVNLVDYTLLAKDWNKQAGENVLLQTIYGTAQDSAGNITANAYRALSIDKGMAMAFAVTNNTVLDKGTFKCWGVKASNNVRIRLFNVSGKGYLSYLHTVTKADPGAGSAAMVDQTIMTPSSIPYHSELGDGRKYTDMVINFGPLEVTAGEYLIVFDGLGPDNTPVTMVKGTQAGAANMGKYPDGSFLPKHATVTTGSTSIGNTYSYQLDTTSATSYAAASNLFVFQILTTTINHAPAVDAGENQSIIYPNNIATLDGTVTDDGLPTPPGAVTTTWTKQSGPGTVTFDDASAVDTTATFSDYGTYVLRLTASDGVLSAYNDVTIDYTSGNQAPAVDAGTNTTIVYPVNSVDLNGTVTDDGKPVPPGTVTTLWTKQSGPGTVVFGDSAAVDTTATFSDFGTYVLRLTANDGETSTYDDVTINYFETPASNQAPVVNAGIDMQIALTGSALLDGTVTDDGLPTPPHAVTTLWTKQSGPGTVTFGSTSSIDTTASFSAEGTYVLRLAANDGELSSFDEVTITVTNQTPVQTATLQWDGGLNHQMVGNEVSNGRWEDGNNWFSAATPSRNRTAPIYGDTVKIYFGVTNDPPNPNSPNFNPQSHITIDTVDAKAGKVQAKEYTNSLTIQPGAQLELRGNVEWYQDWTFNVHDLIVYGTLKVGTNSGQLRLGGEQSFAQNNAYIYGKVYILGATGGNALWIGLSATDLNATLDHNRLYIYPTGMIVTDDFVMTNNDSWMDIQSGGKLVIKGDKKSKVDTYVARGQIKGDGVAGNVTVTYFADSDETVIQTAGVPQVNAGADAQIINPVNSAILNGTVIPDGLTAQWSKLSGPGTVTFDDASQADATATFSAYGTYVLRLEATDSGQTGYDEVTIQYLETAPLPNQAPTVNAGLDQQITLGSNVTLDGTVTDDGLPNPPSTVTATWTMQSGPGTVTFSNANAVDTTAGFSAAGTYVLRLTASDSVLTSYDEATIVVNQGGGPAPVPPVTQWLRIGLHFHSTNSDGAETPETMFTRYRDMGPYDGACITDHDFATDGSAWTSTTYLAITGVEVTAGKSHVNAFGWTGPLGAVSTGTNLQEHINTALANGAVPIVNHPLWTMNYDDQKVTDLPQQIINSTGCKYLEIFNYYCEDYWGWGFSETIYDQVLNAGKQMYCVAGDDAHGLGRAGWTSNYVGATELTVSAIKDAMDKGNVYCCYSKTKWAPGIKLTNYQVSGNTAGSTITIAADANAQKIEFIGTNGSILKTVNSSSGSYTISGTEKYVRARITNSSGNYTWTQPVFVSGGTPPGPTPVIDDYQGYGTPTTGGKGGTDILVTNLSDSGAGSLRAALEQCGTAPHMVKFQVGGCITLATPITAKPLTTIAGETAPSPGITLLDGGSYRGLEIDCHDFIIRHIRFRGFTGEGIQIWGGQNNIIDRCSITGTGDGAIDMNTGGHFIISRCLFGGDTEVHKAHCTYVSAHNSLYAWNYRRQPRIFEGGPYWDFRNNYIENWMESGTNILSSVAVNIVNNYYGPPANGKPWDSACFTSGSTDPNTVYTHGNYCAGFNVDGVGTKSTPNIEPNVTTIPAVDVPASVLADCGAQPHDAIDQYYINGGGINPPAVNCSGGGESGGGGGGGLGWSEAADYYVDGTTGSDSNPGTSAAPWQTLTNAVSEATSGKKVLVWGGQTYTGALTLNNSGTSASPITFKRDPASNVAVIDGGGTTSGTLYTTKAKYIVLDGFTIQNGKYGIYTYGAAVSDWTIKNCRVTNNSMYGIYIRSGTNFSLFNDAVYLNAATTTGIYFFNTATNNNVTQCNVYGQKYGVHYDTSSSGTVTNSIVANNSIYGLYNRSSTMTITYNDVWGNGTDYSGCSAGTGCISADPKWTDPDAGDFHLGSGSPCDNTASDGGDMGYRYSTSAL